MSEQGDPWESVVADERAIEQLRAASQRPVHAYLFVGPAGSGKRAAARVFAASILVQGSADSDRVTRLVLTEEHPDFIVVEREGASLSAAQARETVRITTRPPLEADHKVILLTDFHLVEQRAPIFLKSIEEPPPSTIFIVLAEEITASLVTIASRCVQVVFAPLSQRRVAQALVDDGIDPAQAELVAAVVGGDLSRARVLAADTTLAARRESWWSVPERLNGTGARAAEIADELIVQLDAAAEPLAALQRQEMLDLTERLAATGERGGQKKLLEDGHKRAVRRARTDELRSGLVTVAERIRSDIASGTREPADVVYISRLLAAMKALIRNPNERLLVQSAVVELSGLSKR